MSIETTLAQSTFPFTIFAHGTGDKDAMLEKNIISHFSQNCFGNKLIIDGPTLLGLEVGPNAAMAVDAIIRNLKQADDLDKYTVNLTGLSRGAVTCIHIANLLQQHITTLSEQQANNTISEEDNALLAKLNKLELNIFNIDPVAGMGAKQDLNARIIPGIVTNYVAVLQLDEMRRDFKPQDITRTIIESPNKTHVSWLPVHGNHTHATKIKDNNTQSTALLTHMALYSFLTKHGTVFKNNDIPPVAVSKKMRSETPIQSPEATALNMLSLFELQHQERPAYLAYGQRFNLGDSGLIRASRTINQHKEYYVTDGYFFVNQLERELFKVTYPRVFNYLFELNQQDPAFPSASSQKDVLSELKTLKKAHPILFNRLVEFQKLTKTKNSEGKNRYNLGEPQGSAYCEPCQTIQQLYPNLLPTDFTPNNDSVATLKLKADIIGVTSFYDRQKNPLLTFEKRSESNRTQAIRDAICNIVKDKEPNKKERMLDVIEEHAHFLQLADSPSTLLPLLKDILSQHKRPFDKLDEDTLLTALLIEFIRASFNLVKAVVYLVGSIGFVGGYICSVAGTFIEDLGRRANECIGTIGCNPLKAAASLVATALEVIGVAIRNQIILKPLTTLATDGLRQARDETIASIRQYKQNLNDIKQRVPTQDLSEAGDVIEHNERIHL